ncbi:hypothetical protein H8E50_11055 [bacterium]|nr:hypothetical protein [bacterium]
MIRLLVINVVLAAMLLISSIPDVYAEVPIRLSIKFILDANGNRPGTGNLNTDAELDEQLEVARQVYGNMLSEFRHDVIEVVDVAGISQYYNTALTTENMDDLEADAEASPALYEWRNDAINIYINGNNGSGIGSFPPDNEIIMIGQNCRDEVVIHEVGHNLNLIHTHETFGTDNDLCADTIPDNSGWTRDQLANNNFGDVYANLTTAQKNKVDDVWSNVMSYHPSPRNRLTACQMNRESTQAYSDRSWLLSKQPVYVKQGFGGFLKFGSPDFPYSAIDVPLNQSSIDGKVIVLMGGNYPTAISSINKNVELVTRFSSSTVEKQDSMLYELPVELDKSEKREVREAVKAAKKADKAARKAVKDAEKAAKKAEKAEDREALKKEGQLKKNVHIQSVIMNLITASQYAEGKEKMALLLEIAQRYRHSGDCENAIPYYQAVADNTVQEHLKIKAENLIVKCQKSLNIELDEELEL